MKKLVLLSACLCAFSSVGLVAALVNNPKAPNPAAEVVVDAPAVVTDTSLSVIATNVEAAKKSLKIKSKTLKPSEEFNAFLNLFPQVDFPYTLHGDKPLIDFVSNPVDIKLDIKDFQKEVITESMPDSAIKQKLPKWFEEIKTTAKHSELIATFVNTEKRLMFSRSPEIFIPVARLETSNHHVVVYEFRRGYSKIFRQYGVAIFDHSGKHIATNNLSNITPTVISTFTLHQDLSATIEMHEAAWEKNIDEEGINENKIISMKHITTKKQNLIKPSKA